MKDSTPPVTSDLLLLAERVEAATGPDRELDDAIFAAVNPSWVPAKRLNHIFVDEARFADTVYISKHTAVVGNYTASLDAAMTLVPEGWRVRDLNQWRDQQKNKVIEAWTLELRRAEPKRACVDAEASTAALALCAAALRARASVSGEGVSK